MPYRDKSLDRANVKVHSYQFDIDLIMILDKTFVILHKEILLIRKGNSFMLKSLPKNKILIHDPI